MKKKISDLIMIDNSLAVPIYKQIVQSVCDAIDRGELMQHDRLPSVNSIAENFSLARGSVFSAYNELRSSGIIDSIPGKGYFVTSTQTRVTHTVFLLLSNFDAGSGLIYNSLCDHLPIGSKVHTFFHNHVEAEFESIIRNEATYFNTYVIVPGAFSNTLDVLSRLDQRQVILLDAGYKEFRKQFAGVYRSAEKALYSMLTEHKQSVHKYKRLFLIVPDAMPLKDIVSGFKKFGKTSDQPCEVLHVVDAPKLRKGDAFIVSNDHHLAELIAAIRAKDWRPGEDIGILSLNECGLKSALEGGISTLATDYHAMGHAVAEMISGNDRRVVETPFIFTDRKSF